MAKLFGAEWQNVQHLVIVFFFYVLFVSSLPKVNARSKCCYFSIPMYFHFLSLPLPNPTRLEGGMHVKALFLSHGELTEIYEASALDLDKLVCDALYIYEAEYIGPDKISFYNN